MSTAAETAINTDTTEIPRYELLQTFTHSDGYTDSHRTTFYGTANKARKERIDRLKAAGRKYKLDGDTVTYAGVGLNGYETRLEWVQL